MEYVVMSYIGFYHNGFIYVFCTLLSVSAISCFTLLHVELCTLQNYILFFAYKIFTK